MDVVGPPAETHKDQRSSHIGLCKSKKVSVKTLRYNHTSIAPGAPAWQVSPGQKPKLTETPRVLSRNAAAVLDLGCGGGSPVAVIIPG